MEQLVYTLIYLLVAIAVVCVLVWAARTILGVLKVGEPITTVVYVLIVLIALVAVLQIFGFLGGGGVLRLH